MFCCLVIGLKTTLHVCLLLFGYWDTVLSIKNNEEVGSTPTEAKGAF